MMATSDEGDTDLSRRGACVLRGACRREQCASCLAETLESLERSQRSDAFAEIQEPSYRSDFKLPFSPSVEAVARLTLSGGVGRILVSVLGSDAELCELSAITSSPGAASQAIHSDGHWSEAAPLVVTVFLALHDILDEAMGPTLHYPCTHTPQCFPGKRWLPPSDSRVAERPPPAWYRLRAGDAMLMVSTTWHCGGANVSQKTRTLLVMTFAQSTSQCASAPSSSSDDYYSIRPELRGRFRLRHLMDDACEALAEAEP